MFQPLITRGAQSSCSYCLRSCWHWLPESAELERKTIHVAVGRMVNERDRFCDTHRTRAPSVQKLASQNRTPCLSCCCTWRMRACRGSEHHARTAHSGNPRLLAVALVIWPIVTGVPAFLVPRLQRLFCRDCDRLTREVRSRRHRTLD